MIAILFVMVLQEPSDVDRWVQALGSDNFEVRDEAMGKLVAMGDKVLPMLEKHDASSSA